VLLTVNLAKEHLEKMKYLNSFVLIGIVLLFISIAGLVSGNTLLTEPGQSVNPYAWLEYLAAAILMLINGAVSIWKAQHQPEEQTQVARHSSHVHIREETAPTSVAKKK
jgi:hypothetical protein